MNAESLEEMLHMFKNQLFYPGPVDVTSIEQVEQAIQAIHERFSMIHGVIHCAGIAYAQRTIDKKGNVHSLDAFRKVMDVNVNGVMNITAAILPIIIKQDAITEDGFSS